MLSRHRGHPDRRAIGASELDRTPRLQPDSVATKAPRACNSRQHPTRTRKKLSPRSVEIVAVVIVPEQNHIDRQDRTRLHRGPGRLRR
jgi:hypothetical protein